MKILYNFYYRRYHVEDDQKYGHLIPGRISGQLRHALGLKRNELPLHIYRMRLLGYPPGWLEEARISHSGISMFDSMVNIFNILRPTDKTSIEKISKLNTQISCPCENLMNVVGLCTNITEIK